MDRKEYHNESHVAESNLLSQAIWPEDIAEVKSQLHIGDTVKVRSIKDADDLGNSHKYGSEKYGKVVDKRKYFYTVQFKRGLQESFLWVDLVQEHRGKGKENDKAE